MISNIISKAIYYKKTVDVLLVQKMVELRTWGDKNFLGLLFVNLVLMMLILLRSAGYFEPYLTITINLIILVMIIMIRFLLRVKGKVILEFSLFFLLFAMFLKVLNIEIWAERSMIYSYEALLVGIMLLLFEARNHHLK